MSTKSYNFFLGRIHFTSDYGSQNMFVYQPAFSVLELKIEKGTEYIIVWKSKGTYNSKLAMHGDFLNILRIKSEYNFITLL